MDVLISGFNSQIFTHLNRFLIQGCLFIQTQNYLTLSFSYIRFSLMFTPFPDRLQISASAKYSPLPSLLIIVCRYPLQLNITPPPSTGRLHTSAFRFRPSAFSLFGSCSLRDEYTQGPSAGNQFGMNTLQACAARFARALRPSACRRGIYKFNCSFLYCRLKHKMVFNPPSLLPISASAKYSPLPLPLVGCIFSDLLQMILW